MAATADYLAAHPFASPDIVLPPEAPMYRYRPDINTTTDLKTLETDLLGPGSRVDVIVGGLLDSYVLQLGTPTGAANEVVPNDYDAVTNHVYWKQILVNGTGTGVLPPIDFTDISGQITEAQLPPGSVVDLPDPGVDALYFWNFETQTPELISSVAAAGFITPNIQLSDLGGRISTSQLPAGSVASLDDPNVDAVYFWDNTANTPTLVNSDQLAGFLSPSLDFSLISGSISLSQLPPGTVATIPDPGFNSVYYWDEALSAPALVSADDLATFLSPSLSFSLISGTLSLSQFPAGTIETLSSIGEDAVYFYDDALAEPRLMGVTELTALVGGGGGGSGTVTGPVSSIDSEIVLFNSTTGQIIKRATGSGIVTATSGVYGTITDSSSNWNTAYTERHQWDGGATNLTAATGRTSLGLGTLATQSGTFSGTSSGANTGDQVVPSNTTATSHQFFTAYNSTTGAFTKATLVAGDIPDLSATYQPLDSDLTTLAGLTATTNNFIVSVSSAWASRTPAQVKTTLAIANTDVSGLGTLSTQNGTFSGTSSGTNTGDQDLSGYQPLDSDLTTLAGLTATTDNFIVSVASAWASRTPSQVKTTLGLVIGTNVQAWDTDLDTWATLTPSANFQTMVPHTFSQMRTDLGLVIGTNVQAWDADLDALAALSGTNTIYYRSAANTWTAVTIGTNLTFSGGSLSASGGSADKLGLTLTAVKTSGYTAAVGDFVPVDTTSSSVTITLPTAPADGSVIAVKHVIRGSTNTVTIATGGSDVFNVASGPTTGALTIVNQSALLQYKSSGAIWYVVGVDLPLSGLDSRFQATNANLTALAGLTTAADKITYWTGSGTAATTSLNSAARTFLSTPSSANLASMMTDETGTGACVFADTPTLVTPLLGTPTSGDLRNCSAATDSIAGVLSAADHTTLTSLSGVGTGVAPTVPVGVPFIAWKSGVDLKTNGTTTIFTVPSAKNFILTAAFIIVTAATGGAAVAFNYKIQESGSGVALSSNTAAASNNPVLTKTWPQPILIAGSPFGFCATGNNVVLNITVGFTTSTSVTGTVFVQGFYF